MKKAWAILAAGMVLAGASSVRATQTIRATFENYTEGQAFAPSFTDTLSGIQFRNSTSGNRNFTIEYSTIEFGGGNYLTGGLVSPGSGPSWTANFGFTADLPKAADQVSIGVTYPGGEDTSILILEGFNSSGALVAEQSAPRAATNPFTLQITSAQFDITTFSVVSGSKLATGYDNISFTVVPEPASLPLLIGTALVGLRRRRK